MTRRLPTSPVSLATLAALVLSSGLGAQSKVSGWSYTTNITTDSGGGAKTSMAMRQVVGDHAMRLEFVQVSGAGDASESEGIYMIFNDRDSTMTMVMPSQHMATITGTAAVTGLTSSFRPSVHANVKQSDLLDLGPGEKLLGHATHRYRLTMTGSVEMTIGRSTCTQNINSETEMWIAPDIDMSPVLQAMVSKLGGLTGMADSFGQASQSAPKLPKGTALRSVTKSAHTGAGGQPVTVTSTSEIVDLSQGMVDATAFAVPQDYKVMDTRAMMAKVPAGMMDSIMAASAEKDGDHMPGICERK